MIKLHVWLEWVLKQVCLPSAYHSKHKGKYFVPRRNQSEITCYILGILSILRVRARNKTYSWMHPKEKLVYKWCYMNSHCCQSKSHYNPTAADGANHLIELPPNLFFVLWHFSLFLSSKALTLLSLVSDSLLPALWNHGLFSFFRSQLRCHQCREALADLFEASSSFSLPIPLFIAFTTLK